MTGREMVSVSCGFCFDVMGLLVAAMVEIFFFFFFFSAVVCGSEWMWRFLFAMIFLFLFLLVVVVVWVVGSWWVVGSVVPAVL